MYRVKLFLVSVGLWFSASFPAVSLEADPLHTFADCAGRLSAVIDFQWALKSAEPERLEAQHATLIELIDAVVDPEDNHRVLQWRLDAQQAQTVLLFRANFNDDSADAAWAMEQAELYQTSCAALLLS